MKQNPYTATLLTIGLLSFAAGVVLGIIGINLADDYFGNPTLLAAVGLWSNYLLVLGVLAIVAAAVIAGVSWELSARRAGAARVPSAPARAQDSSSTSAIADGEWPRSS